MLAKKKRKDVASSPEPKFEGPKFELPHTHAQRQYVCFSIISRCEWHFLCVLWGVTSVILEILRSKKKRMSNPPPPSTALSLIHTFTQSRNHIISLRPMWWVICPTMNKAYFPLVTLFILTHTLLPPMSLHPTSLISCSHAFLSPAPHKHHMHHTSTQGSNHISSHKPRRYHGCVTLSTPPPYLSYLLTYIYIQTYTPHTHTHRVDVLYSWPVCLS